MFNAVNIIVYHDFHLKKKTRDTMAKEAEPKTIAVILGSHAYQSERAFTALNFVQTAALEGHTVKVFLFEDGVFLAKKGQDPGNFRNGAAWLGELLENIEEAQACGTCCKERGLTEKDLLPGVEIGTMHFLVSLVTTCDKSIVF